MTAALKLPRSITLPKAELIDSPSLRICLGGISKAMIWKYRDEKGFPRSYKWDGEFYTSTAAVEKWLVERGHFVARI